MSHTKDQSYNDRSLKRRSRQLDLESGEAASFSKLILKYGYSKFRYTHEHDNSVIRSSLFGVVVDE